jgi:AcrR family transcriptional regulator
MKDGRKPSLDEVAEAALVSRATAYRYFPNIEALLVEASLDIVVPDGSAMFVGDTSTDPLERIDRAEAAMHRATFDNEPAIRLMLASNVARDRAGADGVPVRQNRRTPLIEAALAPARNRFDDKTYAKLRAALAVIFGSESMVVFRDVLGLDEKAARDVKSWAVRALVQAALAESKPSTMKAKKAGK